MNRQERRAAERRRGRVPVLGGIRLGDLTVKEAEVVEEALDQYALHVEEMTAGEVPTGEQVWAIGRARSIRDMIRAGLEERPTYDHRADREPPA